VGGLALAVGVLSDAAWLKPGAERSPFSWAGALATLIAAVGAASLARTANTWRRSLLAVLLALIAVDQAAGLHERFADDLDTRRVAISWAGAAFVVAVLVFVAAGVLLALEARSPTSLAVVAGVTLLGTALAMRFGGGVLAVLHHLPAGETRRSGEAAAHGLALAGWVLVAAGLFYARSSTQSRVR
jgi:succinate dehydrogenase hydrophobic anchor subunit